MATRNGIPIPSSSYDTAAMKRLIKFQTPDPRRNLPPHLAKKRGEANYLVSFERMILSKKRKSGIGGRNFEMNGYGIADFIWIERTKLVIFGKTIFSGQIKLRAFELKLSNWKQALTQAYRYSYFSDMSIVVLPSKAAVAAVKHLELFRKMHIGLWKYDARAANYKKIYEPRFSRPRSSSAKGKALSLLARKPKLSSLLK
ncbi:MAG: hypothetical protein IMZ61_04160 [Planctomycetes bacterium]|nr:hypothetical protein [Planctomycetota bacterium]